MVSEWTEKTWGELATLEYGKALRGYEQSSGKYRVYGTNGPIGYTDSYLYNKPSVIIGRKGAYRGVHFAEKPFFVIDTAFYLKPKVEFDMRWAYYQLLTQNINAIDSGSAIPSTSRDDFYGLPLLVPPIEEQAAIAQLLGSLEKKIALNQHMNATLEGISRALFKSWFVDFDPVKAKSEGCKPEGLSDDLAALFPSSFSDSPLGQIPQGWEIKALGEYVTIKRGASPRPIQDYLSSEGLPWVKISDATASSSPYLMETNQYIKESGLKNTIFLRKGALILSNSATPGLPKFLNLDACIHDGWLYFPQKKLFGDYYLYQLFLVLKDILISKGNGSVFTNLKTDILKSQLVFVPPYNLLVQYEIVAKAIFEKILANDEEKITLSQLRDNLLPKLISGKLRVSDLPKETAAS